jgi:hypothetical protein
LLLEAHFPQDGLDFLEEVDRVRLVGEIVVEDSLNKFVPILSNQLSQKLQAYQKELFVVSIEDAGFKEVKNRENQLAFADLLPEFVGLNRLNRPNPDCQQVDEHV